MGLWAPSSSCTAAVGLWSLCFCLVESPAGSIPPSDSVPLFLVVNSPAERPHWVGAGTRLGLGTGHLVPPLEQPAATPEPSGDPGQPDLTLRQEFLFFSSQTKLPLCRLSRHPRSRHHQINRDDSVHGNIAPVSHALRTPAGKSETAVTPRSCFPSWLTRTPPRCTRQKSSWLTDKHFTAFPTDKHFSPEPYGQQLTQSSRGKMQIHRPLPLLCWCHRPSASWKTI